MTDRPILFTGPMVHAILDGRKSQTRRVLKPQPDYRGGAGFTDDYEEWGWEDECGGHISVLDISPNGLRPGDRLWAREKWQALSFGDYLPTKSRTCDLRYAATDPLAEADKDVRGYPWRPSIHMPRWASRLTLIVTDVRVQRLHDISREDAIAEGIQRVGGGMLRWERWTGAEGQAGMSPQAAFALLWDSMNAKRGAGWNANPWVVAVTFEAHRKNIDQMEAQ